MKPQYLTHMSRPRSRTVGLAVGAAAAAVVALPWIVRRLRAMELDGDGAHRRTLRRARPGGEQAGANDNLELGGGAEVYRSHPRQRHR